MKITEESVNRIYQLLVNVHSGVLSRNEALRHVREEGFMSLGSAQNYLHIFPALMSGVAYKRAMNLYSTEFFLTSIRRDFGEPQFRQACAAALAHLDYYNSLGKGRQVALARLLERLMDESSSARVEFQLSCGEVIEGLAYPEGALKRVSVNAYERNQGARKKCIENWGSQCVVCDFDFESAYGEVGANFIHVHHLVDLSTIGATYSVDPVHDLRPVCPNCHSMLHSTRPAMSISELRGYMARAKSKQRNMEVNIPRSS